MLGRKKETTKKENTVERASVTLEIFSWLGDGARGGRPRAARMGSSCRELCGRSFDDVRRAELAAITAVVG